MHPTTNIRFVMWEVARLTERLESLAKVVEKASDAAEKSAEKQAANVKEALGLHSADLKERLAEVKADVKEAKAEIIALGNKVFLGKGALWVFGGIFALALVLITAFARFMKP